MPANPSFGDLSPLVPCQQEKQSGCSGPQPSWEEGPEGSPLASMQNVPGPPPTKCQSLCSGEGQEGWVSSWRRDILEGFGT